MLARISVECDWTLLRRSHVVWRMLEAQLQMVEDELQSMRQERPMRRRQIEQLQTHARSAAQLLEGGDLHRQVEQLQTQARLVIHLQAQLGLARRTLIELAAVPPLTPFVVPTAAETAAMVQDEAARTAPRRPAPKRAPGPEATPEPEAEAHPVPGDQSRADQSRADQSLSSMGWAVGGGWAVVPGSLPEASLDLRRQAV